MSDIYEFEIEQRGVVNVVVAGADAKQMQQEVRHYVAIYSQDGPVKVKQISGPPLNWLST